MPFSADPGYTTCNSCGELTPANEDTCEECDASIR